MIVEEKIRENDLLLKQSREKSSKNERFNTLDILLSLFFFNISRNIAADQFLCNKPPIKL